MMVVKLCDKEILNSKNFLESFNNIKQSKISGSSPTTFYLLTISLGNYTTHLNIGRDSRDANFYWIYPFEEPKWKRPLGFIGLDLLEISLDTECSDLVSPWIYESIPM
jgi:hypothetical protein